MSDETLANLQISSAHISDLIDKAIEDTKNGMGGALEDLARVTFSVAEAQGDPILHVLPHAIGGYGSELVAARQLVALPVLPPPMRERIQTIINSTIDGSVAALKVVKEQLCGETYDTDYKQIMQATGTLFKNATTLGKHARGLMPRGQRAAPGAMEE